jgi:hypothetical protein
MVRQSIAVLVVAGLMAHIGAQAALLGTSEAAGRSHATGSKKPTVKEQAANIPAGSLVNVRLKNRDEARGTLGVVSDEGIVLKLAKKKVIEAKQITFSEMKSVSIVELHSRAYRILLPIAIVGGIVVGAGLISLAVSPP